MARSPHFISLVYPEIFRRILSKALLGEDGWTEEHEDGGWQADWVGFAKNLGGLGPVPPAHLKGDRETSIEEAVAGFCGRVENCSAVSLKFTFITLGNWPQSARNMGSLNCSFNSILKRP